ncbi:MAG: 50S ribosomal protein L9 [Myxococcales bacterium]|nr:50S ribosomal protein L9 [Myxococcales bacterium]
MKVILREKVPNLGNIGDVLNVADGYGRNYLLPRKLALLANDRNVKQLEHQQRMMGKRLAAAKADAALVADRMTGQRITVKKHAGEEGKLFGSVTPREIVDLLGDRGFAVDRRDLNIKEAIKSVGTFEVECSLHVDVISKFFVIVEALEVETAPEPEVAAEPDEAIEYIEGYDVL